MRFKENRVLLSPILSLSVVVIFISLGSTYIGKLCPSSFTIHTITKKKILPCDCRNRSYHNSSSSTLYTTSQYVCSELFITLPDHLEEKYLFTLKMSTFLLNCLKVNTSKGFLRGLSSSCVLWSLSIGDDLPAKKKVEKKIYFCLLPVRFLMFIERLKILSKHLLAALYFVVECIQWLN